MARPPTRLVGEVARRLADEIDREIRAHLGPDATFEQRQDAAAAISSDALWLREDRDLREAITTADEMAVDERRYHRLEQASSATYHGRWGSHHIEEPLYREVGVHNGVTIEPLEVRVGIIEHGHGVLHVHCYPDRHPRGEPGMPPAIRIVQYMCTASECGATWRVLPVFLARHLWRAWTMVERVVDDRPAPMAAPPVPARTERRWRARLAATARVLVVLFAASGGARLEAIAARTGLDASRSELVEVHTEVASIVPGRRLAAVAALAHRLERGVRLM